MPGKRSCKLLITKHRSKLQDARVSTLVYNKQHTMDRLLGELAIQEHFVARAGRDGRLGKPLRGARRSRALVAPLLPDRKALGHDKTAAVCAPS